MENKYYTPTIEEFHIGFEYEILSLDPITADKHWIKSEIPDYKIISQLLKTTNSIRVKYLDKEDIESLGFNFDKNSTNNQWKFFKNNICLFYRPETKILGTFTVDSSKSEYMLKYVVDNKLINGLFIKNKSELKKLLKQLNILDDGE